MPQAHFMMTTDIRASPQLVWSAMVDAKRWLEWTPSERYLAMEADGLQTRCAERGAGS